MTVPPPREPRDPPFTSLRIASIGVPVRLGWSAAERAEPQPVMVDLDLRFRSPPAACGSDALGDTVDYGRLVERVVALGSSGEYRLIEHLGTVLYRALAEELPGGVTLAVTVTKRPPLPAVDGGAAFRIGAWPEERRHA